MYHADDEVKDMGAVLHKGLHGERNRVELRDELAVQKTELLIRKGSGNRQWTCPIAVCQSPFQIRNSDLSPKAKRVYKIQLGECRAENASIKYRSTDLVQRQSKFFFSSSRFLQTQIIFTNLPQLAFDFKKSTETTIFFLNYLVWFTFHQPFVNVIILECKMLPKLAFDFKMI